MLTSTVENERRRSYLPDLLFGVATETTCDFISQSPFINLCFLIFLNFFAESMELKIKFVIYVNKVKFIIFAKIPKNYQNWNIYNKVVFDI